MERSTIIAAVASGMLVLVAGVGAVAAVASLQAAGQESLAIGQAQPQAVVGAVQSPTTLTKPVVSGPDPASNSGSSADGTTSRSVGSNTNNRTNNSGTKPNDNPSNNAGTSSGSHRDDDDDDDDEDDHGSDDSSDDHGKSHESEDEDDD
ncbi:MAG: hypothetical protein WC054_08210 [Candidatus Nanopelagicales bacterium]